MNVDWFEVYCLESADQYPMDAEFFRRNGLWVKEREYGTRHYAQMFTIMDEYGEPWIEVRREPMSAGTAFTGFVRESCRLRLVNRQCYFDDCVTRLRDFMARWNYIYKRIARVDICNDFVTFDSGDKPDRFARRYFENRFSKVNQTKVRGFAADGWASFAWESISWGSPSSAVSTKLYNKTKELRDGGMKKSYIPQAWFAAGIIDNPLDLPDVWRVEFSIKSPIEGWVEIEDIAGKRVEGRKIPNSLSVYDARDKLWQRFEDLAYHYFRFKYVEYKQNVNSCVATALTSIRKYGDRELKRKDLCREKPLFYFSKNRVFYSLKMPSRVEAPTNDLQRLKSRLIAIRDVSSDMELRQAIQVILKYIDDLLLRKFTSNGYTDELRQLQLAIASRLKCGYDVAIKEAERILTLRKEKEIW